MRKEGKNNITKISKFKQIGWFFQVLQVHNRETNMYVVKGTVTILHSI
jgi:hypothetical protein